MNLWKDVLVNLKEDGVSAKEAIDVKKKKNPWLVVVEFGG